MNVEENVPLAAHTTFHVGGAARYFIAVHSDTDIQNALTFADNKKLPIFILGIGSNLLVADGGFDGVVIKVCVEGIQYEESGDEVLLRVGAGVLWDTVVDDVVARGFFGIENLAGIPGSVGGAVVQNIGAYGVELQEVFEYADVIRRSTHDKQRVTRTEAAFGYRSSLFQHHRDYLITHAALRLSKHKEVRLDYPDLAHARQNGVALTTPRDIANAVRAIRSKKFPNHEHEGCAGSFFKNPIISMDIFHALLQKYPTMPSYPQSNSTVKIPLAWILDTVLGLKGYAQGFVRVYEHHPLVIVATKGARARDIDMFARDIAERVKKEIGIYIEREVETIGDV